jgi:hypothetical protein
MMEALIFGVVSMCVTFAAGVVFMFAVGATHTWIPAVPTIGYIEALVIVGMTYTLGCLFGVTVTLAADKYR